MAKLIAIKTKVGKTRWEHRKEVF